MADPIDAYRILQVDPEADHEVVQAAYRRLARKYHPDLAPDADAAVRMATLNAAWALVGTPAKRAAYDRSRGIDGSPRSHPRTPVHDGGRHSTPPPPDIVSRDWTSGRSTVGGGFDASMRSADGLGAAGPPPGRPSGSVLNFGRYSGWSLGEIARRDLEYLEWLDRTPIGRTYREEVDAILRAAGRRQSAAADATDRRGLFRRR